MTTLPQHERGQVLPLVAVVVVVAGLACVALGRLGGVAVARAQATTAADAAALAGAAAGKEAAHRAAGRNGGRLASYEELGADTRVEVELGGVRATARARRTAVAEIPLAPGRAPRAPLRAKALRATVRR
jgi:hypothetical protein